MEILRILISKKGRNKIQRVSKIIIIQVTFTKIQQSSIKSKQFVAKQNLGIQVENKLKCKECWLRKVFRLVVATINEISKKNHS